MYLFLIKYLFIFQIEIEHVARTNIFDTQQEEYIRPICLLLMLCKGYFTKKNHKETKYERVAVGRKYPCTRLPLICLLWYLLQSLFHVQMGSNLNMLQSLSMQHFLLMADQDLWFMERIYG